MPFLYRTFSHPRLEIQLAILNVTPSFAPHVTFEELKHSILPRVKALALPPPNKASQQQSNIQVKALECYARFAPTLTSPLVMSHVVPVLRQVVGPSSNAAVRLAVTAVVKSLAEVVEVELLATQFLPFIVPMLVDDEMSLKQFQFVHTVVQSLIARIQSQRQEKLSSSPSSPSSSSRSLSSVAPSSSTAPSSSSPFSPPPSALHPSPSSPSRTPNAYSSTSPSSPHHVTKSTSTQMSGLSASPSPATTASSTISPVSISPSPSPSRSPALSPAPSLSLGLGPPFSTPSPSRLPTTPPGAFSSLQSGVQPQAPSLFSAAPSVTEDDEWDEVFAKINKPKPPPSSTTAGGGEKVSIDILAFPGGRSFSSKASSRKPPQPDPNDPFANLKAPIGPFV